ncbi:MAG: response regulator transcription factor [Gemmatimonadaceae bacterium]
MTIRIVLAHDHPVVRAGIRVLIDDETDMSVVAEAPNGAQAVAMFALHAPDVMLMDLRMPVMHGIDAIRAIVAAHPAARIVALTTYEGDADIFRALDAGASGYLLRTCSARSSSVPCALSRGASASFHPSSRVVLPSSRRGSISRSARWKSWVMRQAACCPEPARRRGTRAGPH